MATPSYPILAHPLDLPSQVRAQLQTTLPLLRPSSSFLHTLSVARNPPPPLPALAATARARLLASDLTLPGLLEASTAALPQFSSSGSSATSAPSSSSGAADPATTEAQAAAAVAVRETRLPRDVPVQVLDIEDLSRSRWEAIEALEAVERGETMRGREVVRLPNSSSAEDDEDDGDDAAATTQASASATGVRARAGVTAAEAAAAAATARKNATHRLVLQDYKGRTIYAIELKRIDQISVGTTLIGEKIVLKAGTVIARGTVLLEPNNCVMLGGKVDAWHKEWLATRLASLKQAVGADAPRERNRQENTN